MSDGMLPPGEIDTQEHQINVADATDLPYEDESFHAVVTDPPYGLAFMGKNWDDFEPKEYQEWCEAWASEALRILKPGGHMLAFSGTRTYHRMAVGVEDAGFEIRDKIDWMYGNGFPKNHDISKAIDKKLGKEDEREVVGKKRGYSPNRDYSENQHEGYQRPVHEENPTGTHYDKTEAASKQAKKWSGYGTALKPSHEPIVVARKPLEEDTIAEQVMESGTGALNIDGTRIETDEEWEGTELPDADTGNSLEGSVSGELNEQTSSSHDGGRYPANVILDAEVSQILDEQEGITKSGEPREETGEGGIFSESVDGIPCGPEYGDEGGPSRFFYTSKASKAERTANGKIDNNHPTVKPVDLMQYLVRLVTAEGQKVCDPFLGSGTTLLACEEENRIGYGSDMNKEYCDIATKRLGIRLGTELGSFMDY